MPKGKTNKSNPSDESIWMLPIIWLNSYIDAVFTGRVKRSKMQVLCGHVRNADFKIICCFSVCLSCLELSYKDQNQESLPYQNILSSSTPVFQH